MKTCQSCNLVLPETEFGVRNDRSRRIRPYCKICLNDAQRARYEFHKRNNVFLHKCTRARSRAGYLKVPFNLTPEYLESIWTGVCPITGDKLNFHTDRSDETAAELDRFVPEKGYTVGNVSFISRRMNRLKNSATIKELKLLLDWMISRENM